MDLLKQIIQKIVSLLGIIGLLFIVIIIFTVWVYYDLIQNEPLNIEELTGLVMLAIIIVSFGRIIFNLIKKKK
jgi:hypothetical protein